ncbi:MAG: hypothetical protein K8S21_02000 [Gemmatimonadetes bacterium]|nr:hypothetical protein [Gemmatimonadota bacterium]
MTSNLAVAGRALLPALVALALVGADARAQVLVVDEGTFTVTIAGVRAGREDFSIRRSTALEGGYLAQGTILRGESRVVVALNTDSLGTPLRFQWERFVTGRSVENVSGEFRRGLWSGRAVGAAGESGREFRLPEPVVGADDDVIHETWFLVRFGARAGARLLVPRSLTLRDLVLEDLGADSVSIAGDVFPARKWALRSAPGGAVLREAWLDSRGRLLRVRIPAQDLDAVRDEALPETGQAAHAYNESEPSLTGN